MRITLPSEHTIELYTDMEYAGTETGAINPEAWPRNIRGVGTHWIDHALMPAEDPGLVGEFFTDVLDFRAAERVVDQHRRARGDRHLAVLRGVARTTSRSSRARTANCTTSPTTWRTGARSCGQATSSRWTTCRSTSAPPATASPAARRSTSSTRGNRNEVFAGLATGCSPDFPTINWTADQLAKGIFYHARELNDAFTSVFT